jgi:hypothetical protein
MGRVEGERGESRQGKTGKMRKTRKEIKIYLEILTPYS